MAKWRRWAVGKRISLRGNRVQSVRNTQCPTHLALYNLELPSPTSAVYYLSFAFQIVVALWSFTCRSCFISILWPFGIRCWVLEVHMSQNQLVWTMQKCLPLLGACKTFGRWWRFPFYSPRQLVYKCRQWPAHVLLETHKLLKHWQQMFSYQHCTYWHQAFFFSPPQILRTTVQFVLQLESSCFCVDTVTNR